MVFKSPAFKNETYRATHYGSRSSQSLPNDSVTDSCRVLPVLEAPFMVSALHRCITKVKLFGIFILIFSMLTSIHTYTAMLPLLTVLSTALCMQGLYLGAKGWTLRSSYGAGWTAQVYVVHGVCAMTVPPCISQNLSPGVVSGIMTYDSVPYLGITKETNRLHRAHETSGG